MSRRRTLLAHLADIRRVADCLLKLAPQLETHSPGTCVLTLWRRDFDLICQHRETAAFFQIFVPPSGRPRWRQFELKTTGAASSQSAVLRHSAEQAE